MLFDDSNETVSVYHTVEMEAYGIDYQILSEPYITEIY
jgi:hypothetical protein